MPNYEGNPKISEYGKKTRFGESGNCPYKAQKKASPPWSVRNALMKIGAAPFPGKSLEDDLPLEAYLRVFKKPLAECKGYEVIAALLFKKAIDGDMAAMKRLEDRIDGKL